MIERHCWHIRLEWIVVRRTKYHVWHHPTSFYLCHLLFSVFVSSFSIKSLQMVNMPLDFHSIFVFTYCCQSTDYLKQSSREMEKRFSRFSCCVSTHTQLIQSCLIWNEFEFERKITNAENNLLTISSTFFFFCWI
jgi:hypothetical protein